ncbi:nucleotide pyrophosphohydrolase [Candidatus Woesearchaeota archaeon]|nr:MAG: nucleotide pyrophosphohydrolase [Candidatus Woesearchaeota archaeon]
MDEDTKVGDLKSQVRRFCDARDWDRYHSAKDLAIGIITESSEILEHFRFKSPEEIEGMFGNPKKREEIEDEIADVLFFVLRLAQKYNIDLSRALKRKIEKNEKKYPVEVSRGSNKKYNEC